MKFERKDIDSWKIADSGLSERVVNCAEREGLRTVGELRQVDKELLLSWRSFGVGSLKEVESFFDDCGDLEGGGPKFDDIHAVFMQILSQREIFVLVKRYGLERREPEVSRRYYKLQQIANRCDLTRERVRQIESQALERLSSRLSMAFLRPFCDQIIDRIDAGGGLLACDNLCRWRTGIFRKYSPSAITFLLSDLPACGFRYERGVFTTHGDSELKDVHLRLLDELKRAAKPIPLRELASIIASGEEEVFSILSGLKGLILTKDGRLVYSQSSLEAFFYELLGSRPERFHYRELGKWANAQLDQRTQKGYGYYLHRLLGMKSFKRLGFGEYEPRVI